MNTSQKFGYRDDGLFGEHITDPIKVATYEITELGNVDIPRALILYYHDKLTPSQLQAAKRIYDSPNQGYDATEKDIKLIKEALTHVLDGRNFCLWLCKYPSYIYDAYIDPYFDATERLDYSECATYVIPKDAIALTNINDSDGTLYTWMADYENTIPISIQPMREAIAQFG